LQERLSADENLDACHRSFAELSPWSSKLSSRNDFEKAVIVAAAVEAAGVAAAAAASVAKAVDLAGALEAVTAACEAEEVDMSGSRLQDKDIRGGSRLVERDHTVPAAVAAGRSPLVAVVCRRRSWVEAGHKAVDIACSAAASVPGRVHVVGSRKRNPDEVAE